MRKSARHIIWVAVAGMLLTLVGAASASATGLTASTNRPAFAGLTKTTTLVRGPAEDIYWRNSALTLTPTHTTAVDSSSSPRCSKYAHAEQKPLSCSLKVTTTNVARRLATSAEVAKAKKAGTIRPDSNLPVYFTQFDVRFCGDGGYNCVSLEVHLRYAFYFQYRYVAFHHYYGWNGDYVDSSIWHTIGASVSDNLAGWHNWDPAFYSAHDVVPWGSWHIDLLFKGSPASYTLTGWDDCYASGNCYTHSRIQ